MNDIPVIQISPGQYKKWEKLVSASELTNDRARGIAHHQGKCYVISGALYSGPDDVDGFLDSEEVVLESTYKGQMYTYEERIKSGERGRTFYDGMRVKVQRAWWVIVPGGEVRFRQSKQIKEFKQEGLF